MIARKRMVSFLRRLESLQVLALVLRGIPAYTGMTMLSVYMICMDAQAQAPNLDADKPIEITADELEVRQNEQLAIFKGNVVAQQGSITMTAARMLVYYRSSGEQKASSETPASGISKIEADGGVFFQSPTESARSSKAVYDVDNEQIRMMGGVTLTRDKSVVKGSNLVYSLKTGRSVLTAGPATSSQGAGRVKGLFVPKQESTR